MLAECIEIADGPTRRPRTASQSNVKILGANLSATATDATNARIRIQQFVCRVNGADILCLSSPYDITGLAQGVHYYVFYSDPAFAGGNITPLATTDPDVLQSDPGYIFIGDLTTPYDAGAPAVSRPTAFRDLGNHTTANAGRAYDTSTTTYATVSGGDEGVVTVGWAEWYGFVRPGGSITSIVLKARNSYQCEFAPGPAGLLRYSLNGGTSFTNLWSTSSSLPTADDATAGGVIPNSQDFSLIKVQAKVTGAPGEWGDLNVYDIRLEFTLA